MNYNKARDRFVAPLFLNVSSVPIHLFAFRVEAKQVEWIREYCLQNVAAVIRYLHPS
jgi:hypothetical protein